MGRFVGKRSFWLLLALIPLLLSVQGEGWALSRDAKLYLSAKREYDFLLKKGAVAAANRKRWEALAQRFEKIPEENPRGPFAAAALFSAGKVYLELYRFDGKERWLDRAGKSWRALLLHYPNSPKAEEARYRLASIHEHEKGDAAEALRRYRELVENYPEGEWASKARERIKALRQAEEERREASRTFEARSDKALLTEIRYASSQGSTRLTLELSGETRYETHVLKGEPSKGLPPRIYVDLMGARLAMDSSRPIAVHDGLLRQVRVGQFSSDVVRVVLDMNDLAAHKAFFLPDPYRLVVDIQGKKNGVDLAAIEKKSEPLPPPGLKKAPSQGIRKIVLDPGHGGKDPGAIGVRGVAEKDVVLSIANKLAKRLKAELGIEVVLTRKDDTFIPLEDRTAIANAEEADLFISLHVNSSPNGQARGVETYYLDNTSDEASIRLAARENGTSRHDISDLQFILSDLTQNSKLEDSITLAHRIQSSLVSHMGRKYREVRDLGVKKSLFYVLVGARMPSVLIELFFITHRVEGRDLARSSYQDAIVESLYQGIKKYQQSALIVKNL